MTQNPASPNADAEASLSVQVGEDVSFVIKYAIKDLISGAGLVVIGSCIFVLEIQNGQSNS